MLQLKRTSRFKKDAKKAKKRDKDLSKLKWVIDQLLLENPLPEKYLDHKLGGPWSGCRECHIEPDWLLIYRVEDDSVLRLVRTGSHSDLFD